MRQVFDETLQDIDKMDSRATALLLYAGGLLNIASEHSVKVVLDKMHERKAEWKPW